MPTATSCVVIRSFLAGKKLLLAVQLIPHEPYFCYNCLYYRVLLVSCFLRDISELHTFPNPTDDSRALKNVKFSFARILLSAIHSLPAGTASFQCGHAACHAVQAIPLRAFFLNPSDSRRDACRCSGSLQLYSHSEIRHCTVNRGVYHGRVECVRPWVVGRDDGILLCAACQVLASEIYFEMLESACSLC